MQLIHQSRSTEFRRPFGAVPAGAEVSFSLRLLPEETQLTGVFLAYAYGLYSFQSSRCRLTADAPAAADQSISGPDWQTYRGALHMPQEPNLFFYWFEIETARGPVFLTRNRESLQGGGLAGPAKPRWLPNEPHSPAAWQITVYNPVFQTPDWLTGAVIYQIFPDRFCRDTAFSPDRFETVRQPERIFHSDWHEEVDITGKPETGYIACDFFGGSLNGIREKLPYIRDLGVTVLYLNPIFQARSNHRYDTGDYERIDPLLGTETDFSNLCREALQMGIRIILDGVFSHTGADSRYFNKYGRYPEPGAWQEATGGTPSPYGSWYGFHRKGDQLFYDSWWGFADLPSVNEHDLHFRETITGENGIARRWLRLGASGWRLDVSDELPDSFLRELRQATRQEKADACLLGEVWEDASNKISYGSYRDFLLGNTHDQVMGYPFQQALIGWLSGHFAAERMHHLLETLREHYPPMAFAASYNLISSHDILRAMTALAGPPDPGSREKQAQLLLAPEQRRHGEALLRLAVLFQMVYPGCPVIYYGDETGVEGYRDPFNRRTFPWGRENKSLQAWFGRLGQLRRDWPVLRHGSVRVTAAGDCVAVERMLTMPDNTVLQTPAAPAEMPGETAGQASGPQSVLAVINRSQAKKTIQLDNRTIHLGPAGWLLEADGQTVSLEA